ncbi:thrombopoietin isoform X2 [Catharus ustulatus]|uniref:thrombopoietin isoform X2 n=1 Tax=Catharus ustulatus TaxID=91951 RepID=UPI00140965BC|nr:thrombopoietin isoform X2 [Catharus ustulatus]
MAVWPLGAHHWHGNPRSPPRGPGTPCWLIGEQHRALLSHSHLPLHPHHGAKATKGQGRGLATAGLALSGLALPREAGTVHKATPSPPGLLLLTSFLLHVKEDRASPTRLVCDNRLIQKYIVEAKDMEKRVGQCQALPPLSCPAVLPLVDFTFQQWKSKSTFSWEAGHWEPSCSPHSMEETQITSIFLTYRQLVQGKLRFFFNDLAKVLCKQGQGDSRDPPCGGR